jgi:hypothetical protein
MNLRRKGTAPGPLLAKIVGFTRGTVYEGCAIVYGKKDRWRGGRLRAGYFLSEATRSAYCWADEFTSRRNTTPK